MAAARPRRRRVCAPRRYSFMSLLTAGTCAALSRRCRASLAPWANSSMHTPTAATRAARAAVWPVRRRRVGRINVLHGTGLDVQGHFAVLCAVASRSTTRADRCIRRRCVRRYVGLQLFLFPLHFRSCLDATLNTSVPCSSSHATTAKHRAATVLMQSADNVVKALFLRACGGVQPRRRLLAWFVFTVLAADLLLPVGLMRPISLAPPSGGRLASRYS